MAIEGALEPRVLREREKERVLLGLRSGNYFTLVPGQVRHLRLFGSFGENRRGVPCMDCHFTNIY